jgi:hypothetical protein
MLEKEKTGDRKINTGRKGGKLEVPLKGERLV